ncbi:19750_t:CDS:1 [Funneliformis geosporum]|uniref:10371_t:CDS:1 n=1 Tax=Funneliformis geosporum TaxID=1117311 RepID=A0A9W4WQY6_9GLOM|nr:10371_t:CDS:1 [Funneliformis geosporum]CAI2182720.1 19750_t:CDS:1 [Funneliformis geosporum]
MPSPVQTLLRNIDISYYYTTDSTLLSINGKGGERRENDRNISNSLEMLIIEFRKAIQEGDVDKLILNYHALKEREREQGKPQYQQNYLTKSHYQAAINLLLRSINNFSREATLPLTPPSKSSTMVSIMHSLFNDMKGLGYKPDTSIYNILIYISARNGDTKESRRIYETMLKNKVKCTQYTFNSLISSYQRSLDIKGALNVLEEMKLYGIQPNTITYNSLIDLYVKLGDIKQAELLYQEMKFTFGMIIDRFTFDCLLNGYLTYGFIDKARDLFKDITNSGIELDICLYTKLLKIYCYEDGNSQKMLSLYDTTEVLQRQRKQKENNIEFNHFISTLLNYLIKEKEYSHTLRICEDLMKYDDTVTLAIIIPAYYHTGDMAHAFKLFKEKFIISAKNQKLFSSLFSNLGKDHSKHFLNYFISHSKESSSPSSESLPISDLYNSMIAHFLNQDDIAYALELYSQLLQQGFFLNIINITILCKKLILQKKINEALQIYYQSRDRDIILDQRGYTILIDSFSKINYMSEAQRMLVDMKRNGLEPNSFTYSSLIKGFGEIYDIRGVETIHKLIRMDLNLDQVDIIIYNSLMDAYNRCGYGYNVLQLWDSLLLPSKDNDLSLINNTTVSIVLDSCGFNRQLFRLNQIWYYLKEKKFNLNQNNYSSYIEALARNQNFNEAKHVLMFEMINDGIVPNFKPIRTLLNFLHDHSRGRDQFEIINWVKINFPDLAEELKFS